MPETADRPSVVLHGFVGGIVPSGNSAMRLARIIVESPVGRGGLPTCSPLQAQDHGDRWSINSAGGDGTQGCVIDIRKRDAAIVLHGVQKPPEVLGDAATVEKFASVLAEDAGGAGELSRQLPFAVTDHGDAWLVRGSGNADRAVEGPGPFHLEIRKRDARVMDMYFEGVLHTPHEVKEALCRNK